MRTAAAELVARCFAVRTSTHLAHLCTRSYAKHMALGDFYDAVAAGADEFIECHMGVFGKLDISDFPPIRLATGDPVTQISDLRTWIVANREECCEAGADKEGEQAESNDVDCTELANLIDNILAVIDRALYKLKFLS
jgi:hypothetical protein